MERRKFRSDIPAMTREVFTAEQNERAVVYSLINKGLNGWQAEIPEEEKGAYLTNREGWQNLTLYVTAPEEYDLFIYWNESEVEISNTDCADSESVDFAVLIEEDPLATNAELIVAALVAFHEKIMK